MPLLLRCVELQVGMRLAEAFRLNGRTMVAGGKTLNAQDVDILSRKYPDAMLKIGDPVLDTLAEFEDDTRDRETANHATAAISRSLTDVHERLASRSSVASIDFDSLRETASEVMEYLAAHPVSAALLTGAGGEAGPAAEHAGAVFYLSIVLGTAVRDYVIRERQRQTHSDSLPSRVAMDMMPLGLGAMFMDVGLVGASQLYEPGHMLTDEDTALIRAHPIAGAEMLPDTLPPGVKMIVRTHHEAMDGGGYPLAIKGPKLHVFSRIVRICDAFNAATNKRIYPQAKSACRVLWEMCHGPHRGRYDPALLKVLGTLIQPFPIGAKIKLTDGRSAVVVRYNRLAPFKPECIVAFDSAGQRLPVEMIQPPVKLGDADGLQCASFDGEDLTYLNAPSPELVTSENGMRLVTPMDASYP